MFGVLTLTIRQMNFYLGIRRQLPNTASALLVAVLHIGFVWVMLVSVGGPSSLAVRAGQVSSTTVLILDSVPPQQRTTVPALAADEVPDVSSSMSVVLETPQLPLDAASDSVPPMSGLSMLWVGAETPSVEVLRWREAVRREIERTWVRPPGSGVDSSCRVMLIQNSSGGVIGARVVQCDAEDSVRSSLVAAIFHASPLPPYPQGQPARDAEIEFRILNAIQSI